jgi:hypothetical protein
MRALMIEGGQSVFGYGLDMGVLLFVLTVLVLIASRLYPTVAR